MVMAIYKYVVVNTVYSWRRVVVRLEGQQIRSFIITLEDTACI